MRRRKFLFWAGFGLFTLGEKLRIDGLDRLAAAMLRENKPAKPTHWRAEQNELWRWYERETLIDGRWHVSGITTPMHRETGLPYDEHTGYLDPSLVPVELRVWDDLHSVDESDEPGAEPGEHRPSAARRARHGRPPSKWLRSLNAEELRVWLKTIEVSEASVQGMTYFTHLTRDHFFDADKVRDLSVDEQAKLHAAAHEGY
jgi:hypothetical protein